jgi:hypothetical protein
MKTVTNKILSELHAAGERRAVELPLSATLYPVACLREGAACSAGCSLELIECEGVVRLRLEVHAASEAEARRRIGDLLNHALVAAVRSLAAGQDDR